MRTPATNPLNNILYFSFMQQNGDLRRQDKKGERLCKGFFDFSLTDNNIHGNQHYWSHNFMCCTTVGINDESMAMRIIKITLAYIKTFPRIFSSELYFGVLCQARPFFISLSNSLFKAATTQISNIQQIKLNTTYNKAANAKTPNTTNETIQFISQI